MSIFQIKWFYCVITFLFFFGKCENLGRSDDAKRRKKGMALEKTRIEEIGIPRILRVIASSDCILIMIM